MTAIRYPSPSMKNRSTDRNCGWSVGFHAGSMGIVSVFESVSFPRIALLSLPNISIERMISCRVTGILLMELSLGMASSDGKNNRRRTRAASSAFFTCRFVYFNLLLFDYFGVRGVKTIHPSHSLEEQGITPLMLNCVLILFI